MNIFKPTLFSGFYKSRVCKIESCIKRGSGIKWCLHKEETSVIWYWGYETFSGVNNLLLKYIYKKSVLWKFRIILEYFFIIRFAIYPERVQLNARLPEKLGFFEISAISKIKKKSNWSSNKELLRESWNYSLFNQNFILKISQKKMITLINFMQNIINKLFK